MNYTHDLNALEKRFGDVFGKGGELRFFDAPGRVNLIGEHIDYCGGRVFPAALTLSNTVVCRKNGTRTVRMFATDLGIISEFSLDDIDAARTLKWGNYQAGVAAELAKLGCRLEGADMLFDSTLPFGSGLSSSASIELVTALALLSLSGNSAEMTEKLDRVQLALAGQRAEHNFCGVNCGIMDQFASAMGKADNAILLDCATLDYSYIPLRLGEYSLVLANTKKKHSLGASKYNERRKEVEEGLKLMHEALPGTEDRKNLCDYSEDDFTAAKRVLDKEPVIRNRTEHVIRENARVSKAAEALRSGDLVKFGTILKKANDSIRYLYEVTGDELDAMFEEAQYFDYCIGSRMTGAGFGGCTVNIIPAACADEFCRELGSRYEQRTGIRPEFYICSIGDGVRELTV
ncbi:MAG: galactokinase [Clostridia bacterium]|nr:galactokinase [Clostridia bacterium]